MKTKKNILGFTLIEILTVISIFGILVSLVGVSYSQAVKRGRDQDLKNDLHQYQIALEAYANNKDSSYPILATESGVYSTLCPLLGSFVQKCIDDPKVPVVGYSYKYMSSANGSNWVLWGRLEAKDVYWVICTNGKSGEVPTSNFSVSLGNCPL